MDIPDYQTLMLSLLKQHSDQKEHKGSDLIACVAKEFNLSEDDLKQLLPSGLGAIFDNRLGWARTYLKKAGLLEAPSRGLTRITTRGLEVLKSSPPKIDIKYLEKFPEFNQFRTLRHEKKTKKFEETSDQTPQERIDDAHAEIQESLIQELLEKLKTQRPEVFEKTVLQVLQKMGYGAAVEGSITHTGKSGDGGVDGIIKEDSLGLDEIYVQAKRWSEGIVGRPEIDKFIGALTGKSKKGIFITTSSFSEDAVRKAKNAGDLKIILLDGPKLAELMIKHNVGVSPSGQVYEIKKIDSDFFMED